MTNEELKKKIVEILRKRMSELLGSCHSADIPFDEEGTKYIMFYADEFADALIAAGIGDISDLEAKREELRLASEYYTNELHGAEKLIKKAQHRAEVAERALYNACIEQNRHWCAQCESFAECDTSNEICIEAKKHKEELIKQAERELAEESK